MLVYTNMALMADGKQGKYLELICAEQTSIYISTFPNGLTSKNLRIIT